jgi:hypothetical protein
MLLMERRMFPGVGKTLAGARQALGASYQKYTERCFLGAERYCAIFYAKLAIIR